MKYAFTRFKPSYASQDFAEGPFNIGGGRIPLLAAQARVVQGENPTRIRMERIEQRPDDQGRLCSIHIPMEGIRFNEEETYTLASTALSGII